MKKQQELATSLGEYFDGIHFGDADRLRGVLHADIRLVCPRDQLNLGRDEYLDLVAGRPSPADRGDDRYDNVIVVSSQTPTTAHARVNLAYLPKVFTDDLTLVLEGERWQIISKVWDYEVVENQQGARSG